MNRDKIIDAFAYVEDQYLDLVDSEIPKEKVIQMSTKKTYRSPRKVMLIAATIVLLVAFVTVAYAVGARILMRISNNDSTPEVGFQAIDEDFIRLGTWIPENIPEGYSIDFVSDTSGGNQVVIYRNNADWMIRFEFAKPGAFGGVTVNNIVRKENVDIGGCSGVLYICSESQSLFWTNDMDGIGFWLYADDTSIDLLGIANSVKKVDTVLTPSNLAATEEALAALGDYRLTVLPSGFYEATVSGYPVADGEWYGYIRRVYENESQNKEIQFFYETYLVPDDVETDDPVQYILSCHGDGERIEINGLPGITAKHDSINCVYWMDAQSGLVFGLTTDAVSINELIQIAQSVQR